MDAVTDWSGGERRLAGCEHTELKWFPFAFAADLHDLALAEYRLLFRRLQPTSLGFPGSRSLKRFNPFSVALFWFIDPSQKRPFFEL